MSRESTAFTATGNPASGSRAAAWDRRPAGSRDGLRPAGRDLPQPGDMAVVEHRDARAEGKERLIGRRPWNDPDDQGDTRPLAPDGVGRVPAGLLHRNDRPPGTVRAPPDTQEEAGASTRHRGQGPPQRAQGPQGPVEQDEPAAPQAVAARSGNHPRPALTRLPPAVINPPISAMDQCGAPRWSTRSGHPAPRSARGPRARGPSPRQWSRARPPAGPPPGGVFAPASALAPSAGPSAPYRKREDCHAQATEESRHLEAAESSQKTGEEAVGFSRQRNRPFALPSLVRIHRTYGHEAGCAGEVARRS